MLRDLIGIIAKIDQKKKVSQDEINKIKNAPECQDLYNSLCSYGAMQNDYQMSLLTTARTLLQEVHGSSVEGHDNDVFWFDSYLNENGADDREFIDEFNKHKDSIKFEGEYLVALTGEKNFAAVVKHGQRLVDAVVRKNIAKDCVEADIDAYIDKYDQLLRVEVNAMCHALNERNRHNTAAVFNQLVTEFKQETGIAFSDSEI